MRVSGGPFALALLLAVSHPGAGCFAGQLVTLASFDGVNGGNPTGATTFDSAGNLYGTALTGGANGDGTVWELSQSTGLLSTVASFSAASGIEPIGDVTIDSQGNIFGTAYRGGSDAQGTVWEISHATGLLTTLANFTGSNGATPEAGVTIDSQVNIFGTTAYGGSYGQGTVWEISHATGLLTTLVNFSGTNGATPTAGVTIDSQGNLYGTTGGGGGPGGGTVWKIDAATGQLTTLANFSYSNPVGGVTLDSQGNIFGTTANGAAIGGGFVWEIDHSTGQLTTLGVFDGVNGFGPRADVTLDGQGNIYGTAGQGGGYDNSGAGAVWEYDNSTGLLSTVAGFDGTNGGYPVGAVTFDSQGNLFGTTNYGGANNDGTVWELELSAVPEPSAFVLLGAGLVVLTVCRRLV